MTLTELFDSTNIGNPVLVVKDTQVFLMQAKLPNGDILGLDFQARTPEGFANSSSWAIIPGSSTGWTVA